jgi:hypothetical protein
MNKRQILLSVLDHLLTILYRFGAVLSGTICVFYSNYDK